MDGDEWTADEMAVDLRGTVLLVDDEVEIVATISRFLALRFPNVRVVTADDGPLALNILANVDPDIVMSDYVMPGMSGLSLLGVVHMQRPAAFRVLLSGYATPGTYTQALQAGTVDVVLQKPSRGTEIARVLKRGFAVAADRRAHPLPVPHAHGEVLIVGEQEELEEVLQDHFRETHAQVHVRSVPSAEAAFEALRRLPADVILADAHLTDMEGTAFLARAHQVVPKARTVLVESRPDRSSRRSPPRDVDHLFLKPIDMARAARTVERLLPHDVGPVGERSPGK